jgi:transposase InsO family protein
VRAAALGREQLYQPHGRRDEAPVRSALRRHAEVRRRWGYRRLLVLLRREGIQDNHKRVYRLYREERLQVRQRRRRKQRLGRGSEPPVTPQGPNERWSLDFVHDDYTREYLWIEADTSLSGPRVARVLDFVTTLRGKPASLITDNGPSSPASRWSAGRTNTRSIIASSRQESRHRTATSKASTASCAMNASTNTSSSTSTTPAN